MIRWPTIIAVVLGVAGVATPLSAQTESTAHRPLFTWRDGVMAGAFTVGTIAIRPFDKRAADILQDPNRQRSRTLHRASVGFRTIVAPGSILIGATLYTVGRVGNNERMAELGLRGTEAIVVGETVGTVLKDVFGRARPFVDSVPDPHDWQLMRGFSGEDRFRSFPSGHTVAAFAAAAAVTAETSRWWPDAVWAIGPAMYGGASLVGLSRMYDNRHWASDVIMGAAIGTFAGIKVVRFHRGHPGNRLDRWLLNASLSTADPLHVSVSLLPVIW